MSVSHNKKNAITFSNFEALERISGIEFFSKSFLMLFLEVALVLILVFSISGMQVAYNAKTDSFSHVILLDSSRSMRVEDLGVSRMEISKIAAKKFVDSLSSNVEFGVISFAGESRVVKNLDRSPLRIKSAIDSTNELSIEGTNLVNAVILADSLFSPNQKKSVLLISDGEFSVGNLSDLLRYAQEREIMINTILVGTADGDRDSSGALYRIDADFMRSLSFNTGGKFFEINSSEIPKNFGEVFVESEREIILDLTLYLLIIALIVFFIGWFINNFRIRVLP